MVPAATLLSQWIDHENQDECDDHTRGGESNATDGLRYRLYKHR